MGELAYVTGRSGTGKSRSTRNIPKDDFVLINPEGKRPPYGKDAPAFGAKSIVTDDADEIVELLKKYGKQYKIIVVDDFQTVMTNEFMRRSAEMGYQKWTDIGKHAWEIANTVKSLPADTVVYILCHSEITDQGEEKIKTLGKLLDQNVVLESKAGIVLKTGVKDGKYFFCTQNNGHDTVKSPEGMFPSYAIQNDLWYVDQKIRNYYGLAGAVTDDEAAAADEQAAIEDVTKDTATAGRKPRKSREEVQADNQKKIEEHMEAVDKAVDKIADGREEVPFEEVEKAIADIPAPELEKVPRRTRKQRDIVPAEAEADPQPAAKVKKYFYLPDQHNVVAYSGEGDMQLDHAVEITFDQFNAAGKVIAQGGSDQDVEKAAGVASGEPAADFMPAPEEHTRRRRRTR